MCRVTKIIKKLQSVTVAMAIARHGLGCANRKNPFWNKSDAMKTLNSLRAIERKLLKIKELEYSLIY